MKEVSSVRKESDSLAQYEQQVPSFANKAAEQQAVRNSQ
jgi:hypothetical protein